MQTDFDFKDMTGHLTGPLLDFYLFYLEIDHPANPSPTTPSTTSPPSSTSSPSAITAVSW
jgi:hypothetical protein